MRRRATWFVLGLVAGMLLFPLATGLPYREARTSVYSHCRDGLPASVEAVSRGLSRAGEVAGRLARHVRRAWAGPETAARTQTPGGKPDG